MVFNLKPSKTKIIDELSSLWFTNESLLIYNNKIIFNQKKQSYYDEINFINFNFSLGFGQKNTTLNTNSPEYKLL